MLQHRPKPRLKPKLKHTPMPRLKLPQPAALPLRNPAV